MLSDTLNTNEVKDSAGVEIEFTRREQSGRATEFAKISESPALPHRLKISHLETGLGIRKRRRSVVRIDKTSVSTVDSVTPVTCSAYLVLDAPVGAVTTTAEFAHVLANILSFCATTGAATTVLFDGTGNGAKSLIYGEL